MTRGIEIPNGGAANAVGYTPHCHARPLPDNIRGVRRLQGAQTHVGVSHIRETATKYCPRQEVHVSGPCGAEVSFL